MTSRYERYNTRRGSVDVAVEHRDRDIYGPGYREHDHEYHERDIYNDRDRFYDHDNKSAGALIPVRQEKIIERDLYEVPPEPEPIIPIREVEIDNTIKVTEHEHEHVHHHNHIHIDHAAIHIVAEPPPPPPAPRRTEITERETLMQVRERRYGGKWNATGKLTIDRDVKETDIERTREVDQRERIREQSTDRKVERTIGYGRYRETGRDEGRYSSPRNSTGALVPAEPRGSGFFKDFKAEQEGWTVVDVPGAGRSIRLEGGADISWNSSSFTNNGVRRSSKNPQKTSKGELWTEITKDLVSAEALDEFGFNYEETDTFVYVFDYLHRDQIQDLIELTKDIRRERVREIENSARYERSRSRPRGPGGVYEHDRFTERRDYTPYGERDRMRESREVYY